MARKRRRKRSKQVETTRHNDRRVNIPTNELRGFVQEDEERPDIMLYPRDPSLDPQLVWQGKDEQDSQDLAVPIVPIYIQEKVHPQAIVEEVQRQAKADSPLPQQLSFFDDFNGIPFEELIEFYEHEQNWSNRMILGDSLQVMTSLAEKEGLKGKVQMIFLDPPYGIKFGSNWQVSTRNMNVKDGHEGDLTRQPEQVRAFRDTWEKGIHSYLAYLRDRFIVAHELLTDSGSIFVQIGVDNVHLIRNLLDEVFGSDNFVSIITYQKSGSTTSDLISNPADYIVWFAKNKPLVKFHRLYVDKELGGDGASKYTYAQLPNGERIPISQLHNINLANRILRLDTITSQGYRANTSVAFQFQGEIYDTGMSKNWKTTLDGMERLAKANRIVPSSNTLNYVRYIDDFPVVALHSIWTDIGGIQSRADPKVYVVQTANRAIERCMLMTTDPSDLVLDPTMGSGTMAVVAEQWGRRWITIDTSRVAMALARTRLMSARFPYYVLADSPEGSEREAERTGTLPMNRSTNYDIRQGFVYERAPHIMLSDISRNEEIDEIYEAYHERLELLRRQINNLLRVEWEEWEIPREIDESWNQEVKKLLEDYWHIRQQRQNDIDDSIARNSETEILYDRPIVDNSKVRVTGAFTVESLSPHRFITDEDQLRQDATSGRSNFETMILENLQVAGVQNTIKNERLTFNILEPFASQHIHAVGTYTTSEGEEKRAAIFIGSEHGTVSPRQVNDAAKEAVKGIGFDVLIVCGFAFDPHVSEEARQYGSLQVLVTRMNPDLAMGAELKTTQTGNLFMVFGEPDIAIETLNDGRMIVHINGLDIYDPTTGEIRSNTTDDIACWFIDTNYNEESFFVRHAYFTGADKPYEQLQRTLRNEIDEEAWSMLYSTESMPFDRPERGKIAVKVINHYGDEVLKVYDV